MGGTGEKKWRSKEKSLAQRRVPSRRQKCIMWEGGTGIGHSWIIQTAVTMFPAVFE